MKHLFCLSLVALAACRPVQVLEEGCGEPTCTPCTVDADCRVYSNPCSPSGTCGHVDADIAVTALGCDDAGRFDVPDDDECTCLTAGCAPR